MKATKTVQTNQTVINSVINGIEKKSYIVIAGMPGQGTLTLADGILSCLADKHNIPVAYIALKDAPSIQHANIHVETGLSDIGQIGEAIGRQKNENDIRLAFIDCLDLIGHPEGILALSEKLKTLASTEQVGVMAVSNSTLEASGKLNPEMLLQILESSNAKKTDLLVSSDKSETVRLSLTLD